MKNVNALNQYTSISNFVSFAPSCEIHPHYDAFGNTIAKGGDMVDVLHFWFSTKYLDHDTGLYYYGYRYYSPLLQRWINRDPIEEEGGVNMYGFVKNNPLSKYDYLGLWKKGETIDNGSRRVYIRENGDTFEALASLMKLDLDEIHKWAKIVDDRKASDGKTPCKVSVPNVMVVFTSKPSWFDTPISVVTHYRRKAAEHARNFEISGYKVIFEKNSSNYMKFKSLWKTPGIYGFVFAGHGAYPSIFRISAAFDGAVLSSEVDPPYKLGLGMFYACHSETQGRGDLNNLGRWRDHIAIKAGATYLGFDGLAWWWSEPITENLNKGK